MTSVSRQSSLNSSLELPPTPNKLPPPRQLEAKAATLREEGRRALRHSWPRIRSPTFPDREFDEEMLMSIASRHLRITDIDWGALIGEGFFGRVYKAHHRAAQRTIVLKELKRNHEQRDAFIEEMKILKSLAHPNVLEYIGIFCQDRKLYLVTEYISGGTLDRLAQDHTKALPWTTRLRMALDLASGMEYVHSKNILHRDLKSANCMVRQEDMSVVIVDFGLARVMQGRTLLLKRPPPLRMRHRSSNKKGRRFSSHDLTSSMRSGGSGRMPATASSTDSMPTPAVSGSNGGVNGMPKPSSPHGSPSVALAVKHRLQQSATSPWSEARPMSIVGSPYWMAPEMMSGQYGFPADVFAFGIVMCELIGRVSADPDIMPRTALFGVDEDKFKARYAKDCPRDFLALVFSCCNTSPWQRPSFELIASHLRSMCIKLEPEICLQPPLVGTPRAQNRRSRLAGAVIPGSPVGLVRSSNTQRSAPAIRVPHAQKPGVGEVRVSEQRLRSRSQMNRRLRALHVRSEASDSGVSDTASNTTAALATAAGTTITAPTTSLATATTVAADDDNGVANGVATVVFTAGDGCGGRGCNNSATGTDDARTRTHVKHSERMQRNGAGPAHTGNDRGVRRRRVRTTYSFGDGSEDEDPAAGDLARLKTKCRSADPLLETSDYAFAFAGESDSADDDDGGGDKDDCNGDVSDGAASRGGMNKRQEQTGSSAFSPRPMKMDARAQEYRPQPRRQPPTPLKSDIRVSFV